MSSATWLTIVGGYGLPTKEGSIPRCVTWEFPGLLADRSSLNAIASDLCVLYLAFLALFPSCSSGVTGKTFINRTLSGINFARPFGGALLFLAYNASLLIGRTYWSLSCRTCAAAAILLFTAIPLNWMRVDLWALPPTSVLRWLFSLIHVDHYCSSCRIVLAEKGGYR